MTLVSPDTSAQVLPRAAAFDWPRVLQSLDDVGHAVLPGMLTSEQCRALEALYQRPELFRSHVVMGKHGYGSGEYRYFAGPLPPLVQSLREELYARVAPIANTWAALLGQERRYPGTLAELAEDCASLGQTKPTPLLLKYGPGDYNRLHQDLYGELVFPLQVALLLSEPERDFSGGEFVLTEQRPRMQARVEVVPLQRGDAVLFPVAQRPVARASTAQTRQRTSHYRVTMRHGVSRLRSGSRFTLGIIFHDAK